MSSSLISDLESHRDVDLSVPLLGKPLAELRPTALAHKRLETTKHQPCIATACYATTVDELLQPDRDLIVPVVVPVRFLAYANGVLERVFADHRLIIDQTLVIAGEVPRSGPEAHDDALVFWRITATTMWQQIDRRVDEWVVSLLLIFHLCSIMYRIYELLWSFHRAGPIETQHNMRLRLFQSQVSRRSVRKSPQEELGVFRAWVHAQPPPAVANLLEETTRGRFRWSEY